MTTTSYDKTRDLLHGETSSVVFLDMDTVLLATHPGRYGPELGLQADLGEAIERLAETVDTIVVVVDPERHTLPRSADAAQRVDVLRRGLGETLERLIVATCSHGPDQACDCAKPGTGLVERTLREIGASPRAGWYITGDQEGVVSGRTSGLRTVRIGPVGEDHLSAVHRPDYEARDLLDAANHIMFETPAR
jgi:histidinol phosphatase-like enzyme